MSNASDELQFFRGFLANPRSIASPIPSGRRLAAAIAAEIPLGEDSTVLELGSGTGAVTQAILSRGLPPSRLTAIESEAAFAATLRRRFAQSRILEGDAFDFDALLRAAGDNERFDAIVSGLPVLGRPAQERRRFLAMAAARLKPGGRFIQFSYSFWPPYAPSAGMDVRRAATVWQNVPPMHIWVYQSRP